MVKMSDHPLVRYDETFFYEPIYVTILIGDMFAGQPESGDSGSQSKTPAAARYANGFPKVRGAPV